MEGGSDSESEGEDLSKEETNNLFTQIMKRDCQTSYKYIIREKKRTAKAAKIGYKKKDNEE